MTAASEAKMAQEGGETSAPARGRGLYCLSRGVPAETPLNMTAYGTKIVNSRAYHTRGHFYHGPGDLSIKCFLAGCATYEADGGRFAMTPDTYLILNNAQTYTIVRPPEREAEAFLAFFASGLVTDVYRNVRTRTETLLEEPWTTDFLPINFFQKLYRHDDLLSPLIFRLREQLPLYGDDYVWLEEGCHRLLQALFRVHLQATREAGQLSALRPATREELYRRLHYARDYALSVLDQPVSLQEMAGVACLSPNHFLRHFKQLFHVSPHQFLTQHRLERARQLLLGTDTPITEICFLVGFESLGSFSTLFRRHVGVAPGEFRRRRGDVAAK